MLARPPLAGVAGAVAGARVHEHRTRATAATAPARAAAPTFALVFLKGHRLPADADAVLHRSPPVPPGGERLFVVLDV